MRTSRRPVLCVGVALLSFTFALRLPASAESKNIEFKGFVFGKTTISEWRNAVHEVESEPSGNTVTLAPYCEEEGRVSASVEIPGIKRCSWYTPHARARTLAVGQAGVDLDEWAFVDGVLASFWATMPIDQLPNLFPPLRAKYGAPSRVYAQKLRNALGAEFTNQISEWHLGSMQIMVIKYAGDIETSEILISNPALSKELTRREKSVPVDKSGL